MSALAKLVTLSLAVSKGVLPANRNLSKSKSKKSKAYLKEMNKQLANAEIRRAINALKRSKTRSKRI
jgi:hypothetical protein